MPELYQFRLTDRELAAVLQGLRLLTGYVGKLPGPNSALSRDEIDALYARISQELESSLIQP